MVVGLLGITLITLAQHTLTGWTYLAMAGVAAGLGLATKGNPLLLLSVPPLLGVFLGRLFQFMEAPAASRFAATTSGHATQMGREPHGGPSLPLRGWWRGRPPSSPSPLPSPYTHLGEMVREGQ